MKILIFRMLIFASMLEIIYTALGGDFVISIDKIDNQPELSREYADWHLSVKRINRHDKVLSGYYIVKKNIVGPKAVMSTSILSNGKFYKMAVNELIPLSLCDDFIYKALVLKYLKGNSTFATPTDCVIHTGYTKIINHNNLTFDGFVHQFMNKSIYGTYKLVGKILNKDNVVVGGATWIVTTKKKD